MYLLYLCTLSPPLGHIFIFLEAIIKAQLSVVFVQVWIFLIGQHFAAAAAAAAACCEKLVLMPQQLLCPSTRPPGHPPVFPRPPPQNTRYSHSCLQLQFAARE